MIRNIRARPILSFYVFLCNLKTCLCGRKIGVDTTNLGDSGTRDTIETRDNILVYYINSYGSHVIYEMPTVGHPCLCLTPQALSTPTTTSVNTRSNPFLSTLRNNCGLSFPGFTVFSFPDGKGDVWCPGVFRRIASVY